VFIKQGTSVFIRGEKKISTFPRRSLYIQLLALMA
jgi:hypothetical protein